MVASSPPCASASVGQGADHAVDPSRSLRHGGADAARGQQEAVRPLVRKLDGVREGHPELSVGPVVRGPRCQAVQGSRAAQFVFGLAAGGLIHGVGELLGEALQLLHVGGGVAGPAPGVQDRLAEAVEGDEEIDVFDAVHHALQPEGLRLAEGFDALVSLAARVAGGAHAPLEAPVPVEIDASAAGDQAAVVSAVLPPQSCPV